MNMRGGPVTSSCGIISLLCMPAMTGWRKNGVPCAAAPWKVSCFTELLLPLGYFNTKYEGIDCNLT